MCELCERGLMAAPKSMQEAKEWATEDIANAHDLSLAYADGIIQRLINLGVITTEIADHPEFIGAMQAIIRNDHINFIEAALMVRSYSEIAPGYPQYNHRN